MLISMPQDCSVTGKLINLPGRLTLINVMSILAGMGINIIFNSICIPLITIIIYILRLKAFSFYLWNYLHELSRVFL